MRICSYSVRNPKIAREYGVFCIRIIVLKYTHVYEAEDRNHKITVNFGQGDFYLFLENCVCYQYDRTTFTITSNYNLRKNIFA